MFGMVTPPFFTLALITLFYKAIETNYWVRAAMTGIRAAIVPIIAVTFLKMIQGSFPYAPCYFVAICCAAAMLLSEVNAVWLILFGVFSGLAITWMMDRREQTNDLH